MKATLVFIFGPNLKTRTLLRPRPKLDNIPISVQQDKHVALSGTIVSRFVTISLFSKLHIFSDYISQAECHKEEGYLLEEILEHLDIVLSSYWTQTRRGESSGKMQELEHLFTASWDLNPSL